MTVILGISAFYHDSAAAILVDGRVVAAAQEERFSRIKHDKAFPLRAVEFCLSQAGVEPGDIDYVGFYDKPLLKFERILETYLAYSPVGFRSFAKAMPLWLRQKLHIKRQLDKGLKKAHKKRYIFPEHHESHAASAFFPSPFENAAIITLDGVGEWATASYGTGRGNKIQLTHELHFPHSLGLLYSAFTYFCGFKVNSGEYKLMGLAPYGKPKYVQQILDNLIDIKDDGSFRMDMSYFNYCSGLTMTSRKFNALFGGAPRKPETPLTQREMDLAASVQKVTEELLLRIARHVHRQTGMKNLCLAGGVALNCVANGRLLNEGPFEHVWIQPASGDAGGALGAAMLISNQLLDNPRCPQPEDSQNGSLLGPRFAPADIEAFLKETGAVYQSFDDEDALCDNVADILAEEKIVGWFQGAMEFGPRALGSRSILADPRSSDMQSVMNLKIKFRESFRPFAPSVLADRADEFFQLPRGCQSPYMLLTAPLADEKRVELSDADKDIQGLDERNVIRSEVPAVTHVDYSARVQTVDKARHGRYYKLLKAFERKTGCPMLVNTSFNVRGEPIVCTLADAYNCFMATNMDVLVLEQFVLHKTEQPDQRVHDVNEYLARFDLD
ncbi:MAG: carbamoyltransferase [Phycisphaerales bacterium]|jgi:carbamoyltransferase|nr:carbamoyltransferase [Phycisphaerales bacterium]